MSVPKPLFTKSLKPKAKFDLQARAAELADGLNDPMDLSDDDKENAVPSGSSSSSAYAHSHSHARAFDSKALEEYHERMRQEMESAFLEREQAERKKRDDFVKRLKDLNPDQTEHEEIERAVDRDIERKKFEFVEQQKLQAKKQAREHAREMNKLRRELTGSKPRCALTFFSSGS